MLKMKCSLNFFVFFIITLSMIPVLIIGPKLSTKLSILKPKNISSSLETLKTNLNNNKMYRFVPKTGYKIHFIIGPIEKPTKKMSFVTDEKGKIEWDFYKQIEKNKFTPKEFKDQTSTESITILVENSIEKRILTKYHGNAHMKQEMQANKGKLYKQNQIKFGELKLPSEYIEAPSDWTDTSEHASLLSGDQLANNAYSDNDDDHLAKKVPKTVSLKNHGKIKNVLNGAKISGIGAGSSKAPQQKKHATAVSGIGGQHNASSPNQAGIRGGGGFAAGQNNNRSPQPSPPPPAAGHTNMRGFGGDHGQSAAMGGYGGGQPSQAVAAPLGGPFVGGGTFASQSIGAMGAKGYDGGMPNDGLAQQAAVAGIYGFNTGQQGNGIGMTSVQAIPNATAGVQMGNNANLSDVGEEEDDDDDDDAEQHQEQQNHDQSDEDDDQNDIGSDNDEHAQQVIDREHDNLEEDVQSDEVNDQNGLGSDDEEQAHPQQMNFAQIPNQQSNNEENDDLEDELDEDDENNKPDDDNAEEENEVQNTMPTMNFAMPNVLGGHGEGHEFNGGQMYSNLADGQVEDINEEEDSDDEEYGEEEEDDEEEEEGEGEEGEGEEEEE